MTRDMCRARLPASASYAIMTADGSSPNTAAEVLRAPRWVCYHRMCERRYILSFLLSILTKILGDACTAVEHIHYREREM